MTFWLVVIIAAVLLAAILAFYLNMTAGRIDRLHRRIDVALLSLDSHLLRRSGVTLELAASGFLDPASSLLISEAAHAARLSTDLSSTQRDTAESELTVALNAVLDHEEQRYRELSEALMQVEQDITMSQLAINSGWTVRMRFPATLPDQ